MATDELPLMSNISTDEITPGWVCFYYDETLGQYVYVGMREGAVQKDEVTRNSRPAFSSSSLRVSKKSTARTPRTSAC